MALKIETNIKTLIGFSTCGHSLVIDCYGLTDWLSEMQEVCRLSFLFPPLLLGVCNTYIVNFLGV
jgi:hypothetical protein